MVTLNPSAMVSPDGITPEAQQRYRAVSPLAVLSVVCGAFSWLVFFHWSLLLVPLGGLLAGYLALQRMSHGQSDATGAQLALGGMILSAALGCIFGAILFVTQRNAIPTGYLPTPFDQLQPPVDKPTDDLPENIDKLEGEKIYVQGYMFPGRQVRGLKQFIFVPTENHCNFCSRQLRSTEMLWVTMDGDLTADYTARKTGIGGRLRVDREAAKEHYGSFPYKLECDYVR